MINFIFTKSGKNITITSDTTPTSNILIWCGSSSGVETFLFPSELTTFTYLLAYDFDLIKALTYPISSEICNIHLLEVETEPEPEPEIVVEPSFKFIAPGTTLNGSGRLEVVLTGSLFHPIHCENIENIELTCSGCVARIWDLEGILYYDTVALGTSNALTEGSLIITADSITKTIRACTGLLEYFTIVDKAEYNDQNVIKVPSTGGTYTLELIKVPFNMKNTAYDFSEVTFNFLTEAYSDTITSTNCKTLSKGIITNYDYTETSLGNATINITIGENTENCYRYFDLYFTEGLTYTFVQENDADNRVYYGNSIFTLNSYSSNLYTTSMNSKLITKDTTLDYTYICIPNSLASIYEITGLPRKTSQFSWGNLLYAVYKPYQEVQLKLKTT